jgi:hypothetical protein
MLQQFGLVAATILSRIVAEYFDWGQFAFVVFSAPRNEPDEMQLVL